MRSLAQISVVFAAGIAAAGLLVSGAVASHGKAGLWNATTTMEMEGMPQMPDMSQMPPEVQARMKAMNIQPSGKGIKSQYCMTQAQVDQDRPPVNNKNCKVTGYKVVGHTYTGDMVCTGDFEGTGHVEATYDSSEHYKGSTTMKGTGHGHPVNMHLTFEGQWVSANCGAVKPGEGQ
ncbi:MAG TPA: DUF3617 domain-containing protein [Rhizomicrobium sp.]|jgi:hypothetical protein